jgi:NADH:ubiquinone oxidoreductase subunit 4 (subunit M)
MIAAYFYARLRCSTEKWSFDEGLYYVASCYGVGSSGVSFLLVLPAIFITLLASACIAAFNDARGQSEKTPSHFYRLMMFFYHKRLNH